MVIWIRFPSGTLESEVEEGVVTVTTSSGRNCDTRMKKVNSRKATSTIAVMSTHVLFLFGLTLAILLILLFYYLFLPGSLLYILDRMSGVQGKGVSVRVGIGG